MEFAAYIITSITICDAYCYFAGRHRYWRHKV